MRTRTEVLDRVRPILQGKEEGPDLFGTFVGNLCEFLTYEELKPYFKEDAKPEDWPAPPPLTREAVLEKMKDYLSFAWGKANGRRGLSANRSINHYEAWLWLLGGDDAEFGRTLEGMYEYYGKTCLVAICERFGWSWKNLDDGRWTNSEMDEGVSADVVLGRTT